MVYISICLYDFFHQSKDLLKEKYNEYRSILNNKALEKQYDKMLYEKSKVSIYQTMKNIL